MLLKVSRICSAITLGRVSMICPDPIAPHLGQFLGVWCGALRNVRDDIEKEHAFLGLFSMLRLNPQVSSRSLCVPPSPSWGRDQPQLFGIEYPDAMCTGGAPLCSGVFVKLFPYFLIVLLISSSGPCSDTQNGMLRDNVQARSTVVYSERVMVSCSLQRSGLCLQFP